jgi:Sulfotransferase family
MLKSPLHLPYLEDLKKSFPDSVLVWTHRDPVECIASACSLYELSMHMEFESETVNKHALGKAVVDFSKRSLDKAFESLKNIPNNVIHIRYADNIKNPKEICRRIVE